MDLLELVALLQKWEAVNEELKKQFNDLSTEPSIHPTQVHMEVELIALDQMG